MYKLNYTFYFNFMGIERKRGNVSRHHLWINKRKKVFILPVLIESTSVYLRLLPSYCFVALPQAVRRTEPSALRFRML